MLLVRLVSCCQVLLVMLLLKLKDGSRLELLVWTFQTTLSFWLARSDATSVTLRLRGSQKPSTYVKLPPLPFEVWLSAPPTYQRAVRISPHLWSMSERL